jgi:hypothetical protein
VCEAYKSHREVYMRNLRCLCSCQPRRFGDGVEDYRTFFDELDDEGKVVFMLGGPVDGRAPESKEEL